MKPIRYLSLFSGIGGFEYGLQMSDYPFENIGYCEIDKYAKQIYKKHFPKHIDLGDATKINPKELPDFDFLVGGFPCQAFSLSGKRKGFDDTRGTLFFEIARICAEKKPRYLLLENVKGLLSHDGGRTYKKMLGVLSELGYDVEWEIYNSKSFRTPQNRERLYIKGYFRAKCGGEILSQKRNRTETDVRLKPVHFNRQVRKRVYPVDNDALCTFLRQYKSSSGLTLKDISEKLERPYSEVEHWFRQDEYFAPPPDDVWYGLKELLGIENDTFDQCITEFKWVDGVYEMDKRAYDISGLSSTLTTRDESLVKINVVGNVGNTGHNGENVVGTDGLSSTLTATNYKHPVKIIESDDRKIERVGNTNGYQSGEIYGVNGVAPTLCGFDGSKAITKIKEPIDNPKIVDNVYENGHWSGNVYDPNHPSPTMMGSRSDNVVRIREDIEVEKIYNTTRKFNGNTTDGTYTPCLTQSMGTGGGNVPMLKLKTNTEKGYDEVTQGDGVRLCHPTSTKARGRTQKGQTGALSTSSDWGTVERDYRIRRLTPVECERLQYFPDNWTKYGADGKVISDTQRYKTLGNAVTTSVVTFIANEMFRSYFESQGFDN